ncbi:MFS general substrate transporter [Apiospora arundinis]
MSGGGGVFGFRHGIATAQLVLFFLALCIAIYFKLGHRNGWFCIGVFSIFRVVGAGCMLGTITNDASSVWAGVFVCESLGMVLIVFLLIEFMARANNVVHTVHPRWFFYPQLITWADIGLAIGGFSSASHTNSLAPTKYTQASFGLFTALYLIVLYTFWQFWRVMSTFPRDEKLVLRCVGVGLPLLAVRTAYSLIYQITGDRTWNAVKGNPTPYLIMTFLPELAIIFTCIWGVFQVAPPPRKAKDKRGVRERLRGYAMIGSDQGSREREREHQAGQTRPQTTV